MIAARVGICENDIAALMHACKPAIEPHLDELSAHLSASDLHSVREIIAEIQQRLDYFGKNSRAGD